MANQDKRSFDDFSRVECELDATRMPQGTREYVDIGISDEVYGDGTTITFTIGVRGALTKNEARSAARAWRKTIAKYPRASVCLRIAGYDSDPRELWHIPEASLHVRRWAGFADLRNIFDAARTPLGPVSISVLAKCGAFKDVDPDTIPMAELPSESKH